ncbi:MAG TPA: hypothetical protein VLB27_08705, partial [candidate division Zixibacteria bacterium]|nr:hypothetical protein [candidate division Zixibacteria bacterium]
MMTRTLGEFIAPFESSVALLPIRVGPLNCILRAPANGTAPTLLVFDSLWTFLDSASASIPGPLVDISELTAAAERSALVYAYTAHTPGRFGSSRLYLQRIELDFPTGVPDDEPALPYRFTLRQNAPNPFNPSTTISFSIPLSGRVRLTVHNILGQRIAT